MCYSLVNPRKLNPRLVRQFEIIDRAGAEPYINPSMEVKRRVTFLKEYLQAGPAKGFVLGISGGLDSSLAGKLCQLAVDELKTETGDETYKFVAVRLPYGVQVDEDDAQLALSFIKPDDAIVFDIKPGVDALKTIYDGVGLGEMSDFVKGNLKARVRMVAQYAIAGEQNLLVVGTDQAVEYTMGFYTKHGDGAADLLPISGLTKDQAGEMLLELKAPVRLVDKTPTADLLDANPGRSDENELGVSYELLNAYLKGEPVDEKVAIKIEDQFMKTEHKRFLPATPRDNWWR